MDSTFLGQGSYGCVYKQKLRCTKHDSNILLKTIKDPRVSTESAHLSKIYLDKKYATREIEIGKHITKIPNYEHYFSPVLKNCNASLAQITDDDIDKCDLLKETRDHQFHITYFTTMTKYIKGQTLDQYLSVTFYEVRCSPRRSQEQPRVAPRVTARPEGGQLFQRCETNETMNNSAALNDNKIFYIHTCLTKSIEILNSHNITHFDLSERNIIMDTTDRPMIIDYGMSIKTDKIKTEEEFKYEFGHYEYTDSNNKLELYEPWCVEIILLIYLNRTPTTSNELSNDVIETMKSLSDAYIDLLKMEKLHFTQEEIAKYKESKHAMYKQFEGKTAHEASKELLKTSTNWDHYAITIICLKHLVPMLDTDYKSKRQEMIEKMKKIITK